jgi:single-strand DNA-binding protein
VKSGEWRAESREKTLYTLNSKLSTDATERSILMARSFNQVILMGNLTRDPELRTTPNGTNVCSFSLALNRSYKGANGDWQEATDYIDVVAWGPLGERVAQYLSKGRPCLVNGRLQSRAWEQDGQKRSKVEVVAQDVTFLGGPGGGGSASSEDSSAPAKSTASAKPATKKQDDVVIEDIGDEPINLDDIPF